VAILDTGVQSNHEFLSRKVVREACFSNAGGGQVSLCPNGQPMQIGNGAANPTTAQCIFGGNNICTHGTHAAGIAAGVNTNPRPGTPNNGVAVDARIVAVQVFTRFNNAADCDPFPAPCVRTFTSDQISALNWVFQRALTPAGVTLAAVNMSLGGGMFTVPCDADPRKPSIDNLIGAGVATVIAAGNDGFTNAVGAPGCISTAVTVGSSQKNDVISGFTNMASMVDLMAPGGFGAATCPPRNILSSIAGTTPAARRGYDCFMGTSMAAHACGRCLCDNSHTLPHCDSQPNSHSAADHRKADCRHASRRHTN
jgi:subtilisin family serine protease